MLSIDSRRHRANARKGIAMDVKPPSSVLIAGRKLAYDEARPANPADEKGTILLLTGLGSKRLGWARQLAVFGRAYRTIALDHRDTGDSDEVAEDYTPADLADDAAARSRRAGHRACACRRHLTGWLHRATVRPAPRRYAR